jgi:TonB family protein
MPSSAESLLVPRPTKLLGFVMASVVGHVVVAGCLLALSFVLAGPRIDLDQKPIKASLVRLGKKRDDKLLPRKEEPPVPPPAAEKPVEVAKPAAAPVETAIKVPSKDAKPDRPSTAKPGEKADAKKSLFDALNKTAREAKDEEGDENGDPNGDSAKQEGERYFGLLNSVVKRNYDVSDTIDEVERRTLRAEVALRIGAGGELLEVRLTKASGNELFDSAVVGAVKKAAPFSAPPQHLRDALKRDGVKFAFTP